MNTKHPRIGFANQKRGRFYPNIATVYVSLIKDDGYRGHSKYAGALHLGAMSKDTYYAHCRDIYAKMDTHYEICQEKIIDNIKDFYENKLGVVPEDGILQIEVSYDGSYAKRGFKSLHGMGYLVEVHTGFIVDFEVFSKYCEICQSHSNVEGEGCGHVWSGKSGQMEVEIAKILWRRSRENFGLEYHTMVADADAAAYKAVKNVYGYGIRQVKKELCLNHVSKRMKTRLLGIRNTYHNIIGVVKTGKRAGAARKEYPLRTLLSDKDIDRLSNYYKGAIRKSLNLGVDEMRKKILATFDHHTSSHSRCPNNEWCEFKKAQARGDPDPTKAITNPPIFKDFPQKAIQEIKVIFETLADRSELSKCQKGYTSNQNESLHSKLWTKARKDKYHGVARIRFLAQVTALEHNYSYEDTCLLNSLNVGTSWELLKVLQSEDQWKDIDGHKPPKKRKRTETPTDAGPAYAAGRH